MQKLARRRYRCGQGHVEYVGTTISFPNAKTCAFSSFSSVVCRLVFLPNADSLQNPPTSTSLPPDLYRHPSYKLENKQHEDTQKCEEGCLAKRSVSTTSIVGRYIHWSVASLHCLVRKRYWKCT